MAMFDPQRGKVFVRVVYDGPAFAGKTTNLKQLCSFITRKRWGELYVPAESGGRTLFFDWLELDGGAIGSLPLSSQLLTVPGQSALRHRRRHLLRLADAVVFVCDSTPDGIGAAREMLSLLMPMCRRDGAADVPLVVQANKQDLAGACSLERVRAALRLDTDVAVAEAEAHHGIGVRETVVLAIRAAVAQVRERIVQDGTDALEGVPQEASDLYRELLLTNPSRPSIFETLDSRASEQVAGLFSGFPDNEAPDDSSP